jgi:hypothetical protein
MWDSLWKESQTGGLLGGSTLLRERLTKIKNYLKPGYTVCCSIFGSVISQYKVGMATNTLRCYMSVRGSTIDLQRSRCKDWFLWPTPYTYIHTYIHVCSLHKWSNTIVYTMFIILTSAFTHKCHVLVHSRFVFSYEFHTTTPYSEFLERDLWGCQWWPALFS